MFLCVVYFSPFLKLVLISTAVKYIACVFKHFRVGYYVSGCYPASFLVVNRRFRTNSSNETSVNYQEWRRVITQKSLYIIYTMEYYYMVFSQLHLALNNSASNKWNVLRLSVLACQCPTWSLVCLTPTWPEGKNEFPQDLRQTYWRVDASFPELRLPSH
jgi:hypothetical protein